MACGIMRIEKRRRSAVYGLQIEANRTQADHEKGRDFDKSDIDWEQTPKNVHLIKTAKWNTAITERIAREGVKERKDSVVLLDGIYTASKDFFCKMSPSDVLRYFNDCLDYHVQEYCQGDRSRVINAVIHLDEETPHLHISSCPLYEDERGMHLSAKQIMGGQTSYRARQDRFYAQVSSHWGLDRGEIRDDAEKKLHTTKREWQLAQQELELAQNAQQLKDTQLARDALLREIKKQKQTIKKLKENIQAWDDFSKVAERYLDLERELGDLGDELEREYKRSRNRGR